MTTLDSVLVRSPDLLAADLNDETVIMDIETGTYFALGEVGADIWNRLATPIQVGQLCEQLQLDYDASPDTIRADVLDLLNDMLDRKLIRPA